MIPVWRVRRNGSLWRRERTATDERGPPCSAMKQPPPRHVGGFIAA